MKRGIPSSSTALICTALLLSATIRFGAEAQEVLHITHQFSNVDARSMIGMPMGSHKTIVTMDGQLLWSQWSLAQKGRAVNFGFSEQFDGALGIAMADSDGSGSEPLVASGQHLDQMRYPFVVTDWKGGKLNAVETAFATEVGSQGLDVVQIRVWNNAETTQTLELKLSGRQRNLPAFASASQLATHDGNLLAVVEPHLGPAQESSSAERLSLNQDYPIPAHGQIVISIKLPYDLPVAQVGKLTGDDSETLLKKARQAWDELWTRGTQIDLPHQVHELSDFYQASVASILMLTEHDENGDLWTLDGPAMYREFWGRGEYFQARSIEFAGYLPIALDTVKHTFSLQKSDGEWDGPVVSGWPAWDNIGGNAASVWDYYLLTRNKDWLKLGYPHIAAAAEWINLHREESMLPADAPEASQPIQRQIPWSCAPETSPQLKPGEKPYWWGLLPWSYGDSGLHEGHPFPHNTWGLYAVKIAEMAAKDMGKSDDAARFATEYASYKEAYMTDMQRSIGLETEDAPYLPAMPTDPGADVSQSLIAVYPSGLFRPDNLWVTNLLKRMRRDELQGLPTHMAWMGAGGVWPSESMNVAETYLRRGDVQKTVDLLIATLNHTYTTDAFKEEIKVDKSLPTACVGGLPMTPSGTSGDVANGHGTGDMPEAWGPANLILLLRDMLLYEDGETLHLLAGIPANWIGAGQHIAISGAPTTLGGSVSFRLDYPQPGTMKLHLEARVALPAVVIRFPLKDGERLRSATVNGSPVKTLDAASVQVENVNGPVDVEVRF